MQTVDIIILSYAKVSELRTITENCLHSLIESEDSNEVTFRIIVIESNPDEADYEFPNTRTIRPTAPFGYHRYLNIGLKETQADFVCFCNNDLIFHSGWASSILKQAVLHPEIMSFGPIDPWLHPQYEWLDLTKDLVVGYEKMIHFPGWCFMTRRDIFEHIGEFDERLEFWYCDDDFINTLKKNQLPHALVPGSIVKHLGSRTLAEIPLDNVQERLTNWQWLYFDYKWNHQNRLVYWLKMCRWSLLRALGLGYDVK